MRRAVFLNWIKEGASTSVDGIDGVHSGNIDFIRKHTKSGERIFILKDGYVDGIYYAGSSTGSALDIASSTDWFFRTDIDKVMHFIGTNKSVKIFAVPGEYSDVSELLGGLYRIAAQDTRTGLAMYLPADK